MLSHFDGGRPLHRPAGAGDRVLCLDALVISRLHDDVCWICEMARSVSLAREPMVEFAPSADADSMLLNVSQFGDKEQFDMSTRENVKPVELELAEPVVPETGRLAATGQQPAGRIIHDERGNAVWKWRGDTSTTGTTSGILKHLDPQDLKVQGGGSTGSSGSPTPVFDAGGGYDPYNQGESKPKTGIPQKSSRGKR